MDHMGVAPADLDFAVADGERIEIAFADRDLVLRFVDWREEQVERRFPDTLAFRWSKRPTIETPRDDTAYEVLESLWLLDEIQNETPPSPGDFVHYVLCFNAAKVLELISRRLSAHVRGEASG
jgi:hypothetical protein